MSLYRSNREKYSEFAYYELAVASMAYSVAEHQPSNLRVGSSNLSGRAGY